MKQNIWELTLVTHKANSAAETYLQFIEACIQSGISCVQLREKTLSQRELFHFGCALKSLLDSYNIPLIINDHVDLCKKLDAFGVHLGQSDLDVKTARTVLGPEKIIGLSVNSLEQLQQSEKQPIDYIGLGAIFPTGNKADVETIWGLNGLQQASARTSRPIVAIGGINECNARSVMEAGAQGIAAIGAFHSASNPFLTIQKLKEATHDRKTRNGLN